MARASGSTRSRTRRRVSTETYQERSASLLGIAARKAPRAGPRSRSACAPRRATTTPSPGDVGTQVVTNQVHRGTGRTSQGKHILDQLRGLMGPTPTGTRTAGGAALVGCQRAQPLGVQQRDHLVPGGAQLRKPVQQHDDVTVERSFVVDLELICRGRTS